MISAAPVILLVEDDEAQVLQIRRILTLIAGPNITLVVTRSTQEAIAALEGKQTFIAAIVDLLLPGGSTHLGGLDVVAKILDLRSLPVIVRTSWDTSGLDQLQDPLVRIVSKAEPQVLVESVASVLVASGHRVSHRIDSAPGFPQSRALSDRDATWWAVLVAGAASGAWTATVLGVTSSLQPCGNGLVVLGSCLVGSTLGLAWRVAGFRSWLAPAAVVVVLFLSLALPVLLAQP